MIKLVSHTPFTAPDYLIGTIKFCEEINSNCMMIYLGAPQNARRVDTSKYKLEEFKKNKYKIDVKDIIVHAPYIINPASVEKHLFAEEFLIEEIKRMNFFGAKYLVLHPGSSTKYPKDKSIKVLIQTLKNVLEKTKDVHILLETMAGKGTEIGSTLEEIRFIIDGVGSDRIGVCLDTCHLWEAGYNINNYDNFIQRLTSIGLLNKVKTIHINDSKNDLGAHKDRHENIGAGPIKVSTLQKFIKGPEFKGVVKVLETPYINKKAPYKEEIKKLLDE